jgi:hypothetical protein
MTFIWLKYHFTRIVYSALLAGFQFAKPKWHERDRWGWLWRALVRWEFRLTDAQNKYRALKMVTGPVETFEADRFNAQCRGTYKEPVEEFEDTEPGDDLSDVLCGVSSGCLPAVGDEHLRIASVQEQFKAPAPAPCTPLLATPRWKIPAPVTKEKPRRVRAAKKKTLAKRKKATARK